MGILRPPPIKQAIAYGVKSLFDKIWINWFLQVFNKLGGEGEVEFGSVIINNQTINRITNINSSGQVVSVTDLTGYIAGSGDIVVTDDGDGTVTISSPKSSIIPSNYDQVTITSYGGPLKLLPATIEYYLSSTLLTTITKTYDSYGRLTSAVNTAGDTWTNTRDNRARISDKVKT